jgi:hypothetical protein
MGYKSDTYQTRVCGHHPETCTCRDLDVKNEPKQETLGEASKRYAEIHADVYEVKGELHFVNNVNKIEDAFENGAKWQAERMYSEEEVLDLLPRFAAYTLINADEDSRLSLKDWFEQFKKK